MHGHLSLGSLNGDGFGIGGRPCPGCSWCTWPLHACHQLTAFVRPPAGWYSDSMVAKASDPTPCVFTSVTPAWCACPGRTSRRTCVPCTSTC